MSGEAQMPQYTPKTKPFSHQAELFEKTKDLKTYAIYWEQGTGKSKAAIDLACYLYTIGEIDAVFIVASNGVHTNWVTDEIPKHVPDDILKDVRSMYYQSNRAGTKWHKRDVLGCRKHRGFPWMTMSYEGFMTKAGKTSAWYFLKERRCLYILDEADKIKNPGGKRSKSVIASGAYAEYKRVMTGTPVPQSPFDVYTQLRFLDVNFWKQFRDLGIGSYDAFKTFFGVFIKRMNSEGRGYSELVDYRNLDKLHDIVDSVSSRVLKEDVLDLPPKLYSKIWYELSPEQKRIYKELKEEFEAYIMGDSYVSAPLAIVRLMRLSQVASGYVPEDEPTDEDNPNMIPIPGGNPRMDALFQELEHTPHAAIIWARYTNDINMICDRLIEKYGEDSYVRYDGQVSQEGRILARQKFQNGEAQWFVGNPAAGSDGITLTEAKTVFYYNNSYNLRHRLQSEDRAHRFGQEGAETEDGENAVLYKDVCAAGTVDINVISSLVKKKKISDIILGDEIKDWL